MRKILIILPAKKGTKITPAILKPMCGNTLGVLPLKENVDKILGKKLNRTIKQPSQFSWKIIT